MLYKFRKTDKWFAWYPIVTESGELVWLSFVTRKWDDKGYIQFLTSYDLGEYVGLYRYYL